MPAVWLKCLDHVLSYAAHLTRCVLKFDSHGVLHWLTIKQWIEYKVAAVGRMLYCSPVWWSFTDAQERGAGEGITQKLVRLDFLPLSIPIYEVLCNKADSNPSAW